MPKLELTCYFINTTTLKTNYKIIFVSNKPKQCFDLRRLIVFFYTFFTNICGSFINEQKLLTMVRVYKLCSHDTSLRQGGIWSDTVERRSRSHTVLHYSAGRRPRPVPLDLAYFTALLRSIQFNLNYNSLHIIRQSPPVASVCAPLYP